MISREGRDDRAVTDARDIVLRLLGKGRSAETMCSADLSFADRYLRMYPDDAAVRDARNRHLKDSSA